MSDRNEDIFEHPRHTAERQRILAAKGWENDRDRTQVLRELLTPHLERIFLWSYSRLRNRDQAFELTRNTLVWISRTLGDIPDDCSLDAWIFEHLAVESRARLPLVRSELGQAPRLVLSEFPNERYLVDYPETKKLLDAYREYLALSTNLQLVSRSGWGRAAEDLHRFMDAQFGEEGAGTPSPRKQRFSRRHVTISGIFTAAVFLGLLAFSANLWLQNRDLRAEADGLRAEIERATHLVSANTNPRPAVSLEASVERTEDVLRFVWDSVARAAFYRLTFCTARMDTLYQRNAIRGARYELDLYDIPEFDPEGNYLYKIDAVRGMDELGTTGYLPYPPI